MSPGPYTDTLGPGETRWHRLLPDETRCSPAGPVGTGCTSARAKRGHVADFANGPVHASGSAVGLVTATARGPDLLPVEDACGTGNYRSYDGSPTSVGLGTVPVSWTGRRVDSRPARAVRQAGDHRIAVGPGPGAAGLAALAHRDEGHRARTRTDRSRA